MPRIAYIENGYSDIWESHLERLLNKYKEDSTEVSVRHLSGEYGEQFDKSLFTPALPYYYGDLFYAIHELERDGYDAVVIGCSADPGLRTARYMSSIPVFAPLKSALHIAQLLGKSNNVTIFKSVHDGQEPRLDSWHKSNIRDYGMDVSCINIRRIQIVGLEKPKLQRLVASGDFEAVRTQVLSAFSNSIVEQGVAASKRAVHDDEASALYFACTLWSGMLEPVAHEVDVPVLDPVLSALKAAELAIAARVRESEL